MTYDDITYDRRDRIVVITVPRKRRLALLRLWKHSKPRLYISK